MLTMKGKYGLKAMAELADLPENAVLQSADIARRHRISKKFLDAILAELREANLIAARRGPGGGYYLRRPPEGISVGEVMRVLGGKLAPIACASRTGYLPCADCPDEQICSVRLTMLDARDALAAVLDAKSLLDFARMGRGDAAPSADAGA